MYVPARSQNLSETIIYPIEQSITGKNTFDLDEIKSAIRSCFALLLTAVSFSMFLLSVALGQGDVKGFYLCIFSACLIASLPFFGATLMVRTYERLMKDNPVQHLQESDGDVCCTSPLKSSTASVQAIPLSLLQCYQNQQDWLWQGWKVRYTFIHNPQSQVPVILLHGFGGSIGHWRQNIAELAKHHSVYALDLLGFGASEKPAALYGISLWTEQVYEFWKTFVKVPAVLVGNSIGSVTCLAAAATHPEMARGVAMISLPDTSGREECIPVVFRPLVRKIKSAFASPLVLQPLFHLLRQPYILRRWVGLAYACKEAITDELLEIISAPARELGSAQAFCTILRAMLSPKFSPCIKSILSNLQIPSLLLSGQKDRMVPPTSARRFLGYNLLLQLVELENAGHCAHDECPERVNQELLNWIQTRVLGRVIN
ncbi:MAG TPA: alpha/beta fold hydrolase [Allocoleopsis sp.]